MCRPGRFCRIGPPMLAYIVAIASFSQTGLAQIANPLARVGPSPLTAKNLVLNGLVVELEFHEAAYRETKLQTDVLIPGFRAAPQARFDLKLEQFFVTTPQTRFVRDGDIPVEPPDVVLLRGSIVGEPDSRVFLGLSPHGTNGFIDRGDEMYLITTYAPDPARKSERVTYAFLREAMPPADKVPFVCLTDTLAPLPVLQHHAGGPRAGGTCVEAVVAIETDYQFFLKYGNEAAANAYIVQLVGATSDIFERDVQIQLQIGFSRLWTTAADPWTDSSSQDLIEFQDYWNANMTHISRTSVHLLSGKSGGGVAYYPGMCFPDFDYALSHVNGWFPEPIRSNNGGNWDLHVVPHEWGHMYGSPHTHDFVPPIDTCASDCGDGLPRQGTLMSYCHGCSGGENNIVLQFHSRVRVELITVSSATGCLTVSVDCDHPLRGDVNCDGVINALDIQPFVLSLLDRATYDALYPACDVVVLGDTDGNGFFDAQDVDAFTDLLLGL